MAAIKGRNTKPEVLLRGAMHRLGFRYRLHAKDLPGKPDLVFPRFKAAVFVEGCYWHRHEGCRYSTTPATNQTFWVRKFAENVARDKRHIDALRDTGWRVARVWECGIREGSEKAATSLADWLRGTECRLDWPW